MTSRSQIIEEVSSVARRAYQRGLQTGTGGNLSARLPGGDRIVIKASGVGFADCTPENLVEVEVASGQALDGKPSSELQSHLAIYRTRPDVGGIFHCHAPWSIASAEVFETIPAIARHSMQKLGAIPVLRTGTDPTALDVTDAIVGLLNSRPGIAAFIESQHGIFSFAASLTMASYNAELVDETAQIAVLSALMKRTGTPPL